MEQEAEIFGYRTISGFLSQVGAEEPSNSDRVAWSEQGRLHLTYTATYAGTNTITIDNDIDGNDITTATCAIRAGDTVIVSSAAGNTAKCHVTTMSGLTLCLTPTLS
jgi:hypothetical protein